MCGIGIEGAASSLWMSNKRKYAELSLQYIHLTILYHIKRHVQRDVKWHFESSTT